MRTCLRLINSELLTSIAHQDDFSLTKPYMHKITCRDEHGNLISIRYTLRCDDFLIIKNDDEYLSSDDLYHQFSVSVITEEIRRLAEESNADSRSFYNEMAELWAMPG